MRVDNDVDGGMGDTVDSWQALALEVSLSPPAFLFDDQDFCF